MRRARRDRTPRPTSSPTRTSRRGDLVTVDDPVIGPVRQQAPYPRVVGEPTTVPAGAPRLGEHTRSVLAETLGVSDVELDRLAAEGVI